MNTKAEVPWEIAVPVSVFRVLMAELEKTAGTLPTVHALHQAGYQAGATAAPGLVIKDEKDETMMEMEESAFWNKLTEFFQERGWGTLIHRSPSSAVGILCSSNWAEASIDSNDPTASCFFSTGFFSGLLTELAGSPIAVLEIECRTRGEDACEFAFGSEGAIHRLYRRLLEGVDLDGALTAL